MSRLNIENANPFNTLKAEPKKPALKKSALKNKAKKEKTLDSINKSEDREVNVNPTPVETIKSKPLIEATIETNADGIREIDVENFERAQTKPDIIKSSTPVRRTQASRESDTVKYTVHLKGSQVDRMKSLKRLVNRGVEKDQRVSVNEIYQAAVEKFLKLDDQEIISCVNNL